SLGGYRRGGRSIHQETLEESSGAVIKRAEYAHSITRIGAPGGADSKHAALAHTRWHFDGRLIKVLELWNRHSVEGRLLLKNHDELVRKSCRGGHCQIGAARSLLSELKRTVMRDDYFDVNGFALRSCHSDGTAPSICDLPSGRHTDRGALVGRSVGLQLNWHGCGGRRLRPSGGNDWNSEGDQDHRHGGDPQRFHGIADLHGLGPSDLVLGTLPCTGSGQREFCSVQGPGGRCRVA